jgi:hypothetical protein
MKLLAQATARVKGLKKGPRKLRVVAGALVVSNLVIPIVLSWYDYSTLQLVLAMILLDVCLYPTYRYLARKETGLPIAPVLCMSFAVQYSLPIFTQEPKVVLVSENVRYLEGNQVVLALLMSIIGVCLFQFVYYLIKRPEILKAIPPVKLHLNRRTAEMFCVAVFVISLLAGRFRSFLPEDSASQFNAVVGLVQNQLLVVIVILAWLASSGQKQKRHLMMLYFVVIVAALRGFSTTMMELMMVPLAVLLMARWAYTQKLPVGSLAAIALAFLFFSPVKMNIRSTLQDDSQGPTVEQIQNRALDWVNESSRFWQEVFEGKRSLVESTADASSRTDLIHSFAHIYSFTPSMVPYQYGATYSYLTIAWIPRAIWPEKPIANYANNFYAVEYGISTEEGVKTSSFGATLMGEGFINFGVAGVALVMIVLGLAISLMERVFGSEKSGVGGQAVFLAVFVYFLNGIGTSAELLFGGLVQNLVCGALIIALAKAATSIVRLPKRTLAAPQLPNES